ncbi:hypothetical protein J3369_20210 [Alteromonas sp. NFXS44]|uniref:S10 family serine carboxypeptidase-like protein n=1 Tax=Alteromonas sp. NFXS44 TaxID=2818435 RepID=UPI0032DED3F7
MFLKRTFFCLAGAALITSAVQAQTNWIDTRQTQQYTIDGEDYRYKAVFNEMAINENTSISSTAYIVDSKQERPVLFAFNGGPGSSASTLQFSGVGPWSKVKNSDGEDEFILNPSTSLKFADLVFIDPPGTGFSKPSMKAESPADFWTPKGDAQVFNEYIEHWLKKHGREDATVFLAGESYGGYRLAQMLGQPFDFKLGGVLLVSPLLDASGNEGVQGNIMPYLFSLPTFAVAAAEHGMGSMKGMDHEAVYTAAKSFAMTDYVDALLKGGELTDKDAYEIAGKMANFLGLSRDVILDHDLKIDGEFFRMNLLKPEGKQFGRLDARMIAPLPEEDNGRVSAMNDPSLGLGNSLIIQSDPIKQYLKREVGIENDLPYVSLSLEVNGQWRYGNSDSPWTEPNFYFNPTPNIASQVENNPDMKVLVVTGYYDLAVPALSPWYALMHSGLKPEQVTYEIIASGHSVFAEDAELPRLENIMEEFLKP